MYTLGNRRNISGRGNSKCKGCEVSFPCQIKNDKETDVAEEEKGIDAKARRVTGARECRALWGYWRVIKVLTLAQRKMGTTGGS